MGKYLIEIEAVGSHGCDRRTKEGGELLPPCKSETCAHGGHATMTHWPDQPSEVVDDLVANVRKKGSF